MLSYEEAKITFLPLKAYLSYKKCGWVSYEDFLNCEKCNISSGERIIKEHLIKNDIIFISQKKFDGCINKRKLSFDFYIPEKNICIEFDGLQHFKAIKKYGGDIGFEKENIMMK